MILTPDERRRLNEGTLSDIERARIKKRVEEIPIETLADAVIAKAEGAGMSLLEFLAKGLVTN